jgi:hypothetical protein
MEGTLIFDRLRYELQLMGKRVIMTPILLMIGFALFAVFLQARNVNPARFLSGGLEIILPIATAVVVATIASHDPAIELQLTTPRKYARTAMGRMALIVTWAIGIALLSSVILYSLRMAYVPQQLTSWATPLQFLTDQLTWLAPLLWMVAVGLCLALLLRSRAASAAILGSVWILEIIFKDYLAATTWLHPVLLFPTTLILFPTTLIPNSIFWTWLFTRLEIVVTGVVLLLLGWLLLQYPEGLLKGASEE